MPQAEIVQSEKIRQAIQELNKGWPNPTIIDVTPMREQLLLIAGDTEESIFKALGVPWREPWERH